MTGKAGLDPDMTINQIMRQWPSTIGVVLEYDLHCVGCPINDFHTVSDVCFEHNVKCSALVAALEKAILQPPAHRVASDHQPAAPTGGPPE